MKEFSDKIIQSELSAQSFMRTNIKPQCVRLEKLCFVFVHHLLIFLWYGNTTNSGWSERSWMRCEQRSNRSQTLHIHYYSPNRITADEVKCKYTVCLCKREARLHIRLQISNSELWCQTNCMCAWLCVWLCVIDSPVLNPHCCICCFLFCLLHFIMNCCTQLVCDTLKATWTFLSWMLCDHKTMKCCSLHSAKGSPCND